MPDAANAPPTPNEIAQKLIHRDYLSWSSISTFLRCPKRFKSQYIDGIEPDFVSSNLVFGSAIHSAVESVYRALFAGKVSPDVDDLLKVFDSVWKEETRPIRYGKNESTESLRDLARRMLDAFLASPDHLPDAELIGVEEELRGAIIDGVPDILGRVDLIVRTDRAIRLIDFKTSKASWSAAKIEESAPQMLLYTKLAAPIARSFDLPVEVAWVVLTKHKQPRIETHCLAPNPDRVGHTCAMVREVWRAMQQRYGYAIPSAMNCSTCPFQETCSAWGEIT
ncbi:MAG TPA: PD-(D/E)XK nuclease family protein [Phycisphaerae bacterium]|nr:PD-(D/E)XK nuclease family protein [Phycisphaerae bacterium]